MSAALWAIRLDPRDAASAGRLRQAPGVEVCEHHDAIWLRGPGVDEKVQWQLAAVAGAMRFIVLADGQLVPTGRRLPQGRLPHGPWTPIARWMGLALPPGQLAGRTAETVALRLVRTETVTEPSLLLTNPNTWRAYAIAAPQVRLERWRFAVAADGRVAIYGRPLPPLPGQRWVEEQGIAVPAGWTWTPAVEASIVRDMFKLAAGDIALWHESGEWEHVQVDEFVKATRSAARQVLGLRS